MVAAPPPNFRRDLKISDQNYWGGGGALQKIKFWGGGGDKFNGGT